jgi:hypothetical protein
MTVPSHRVPSQQVVVDAETARLALARMEQAAGAGRLDRDTVAVLVERVGSGGQSLVGLLRRLVHDLDIDDDSPEAPHLRAASEHARLLMMSLRDLGAAIQGGSARTDPPS